MCVRSVTFSQALLQLNLFSGFTPAQYNYSELFRGQSLAFASRGNLPIAGWETEGPFGASQQQPASLLPCSFGAVARTKMACDPLGQPDAVRVGAKRLPPANTPLAGTHTGDGRGPGHKSPR